MSLKLRPLSREEVRGVDARAAELGMPTALLMENAGRGAADWLDGWKIPQEGRFLVLCGPGNNGGDGAVVARHLDARGRRVRVVWFFPPDKLKLKGDAALQWGILDRSGIDQTAWHDEASITPERLDALIVGADCVIDGLLGTGLTRPVEGTLLRAIEAINRAGKPTLALDLPSGLDADTGQPLGAAVRATGTATFVAPKIGFDKPGAKAYTGEVVVIDIGVPRIILAPFLPDS